MIKRYTYKAYSHSNDEAIEDAGGAMVRYKDHLAEISAIQSELDANMKVMSDYVVEAHDRVSITELYLMGKQISI